MELLESGSEVLLELDEFELLDLNLGAYAVGRSFQCWVMTPDWWDCAADMVAGGDLGGLVDEGGFGKAVKVGMAPEVGAGEEKVRGRGRASLE